MRIEHSVHIDAPVERVWELVNDIPRAAPCMPGAALTGMVDDRTYDGTVAVKLGPLRMNYKGRVVVTAVDEAAHSAALEASGKDVKGSGTARASVQTRLEPDGASTRLTVTSDLQLTGKVASFGRGGAINDVAAKLFGQFAECLRATLEQEATAVGPTREADAVESKVAGQIARATGSTVPGEPVDASMTAVAAGPATAGPGPARRPATAGVPAAWPGPAGQPLRAGGLVGAVVLGRLRALGRRLIASLRDLLREGRRSARRHR